METPTIAKRSACDRCRSKRVRCPRACSSTGPCSRCINAGAACITGFPGNPGRPRKTRKVEVATPQTSAALDAPVSFPEYWPATNDIAHLGEADHHLNVAERSSPSLSVTDPTAWFGAGPGSESMLLNVMDDVVEPSPFELLNNEQDLAPKNSNLWTSLSRPPPDVNSTAPMIDLPLLEDLICPMEIQQPPLDTSGKSNSLRLSPSGCHVWHSMCSVSNQSFDADIGLSNHQQPRLENRLEGFRKKMDQDVATLGAFFSDVQTLADDCETALADEPAAPVSMLLKGITEFTDILQNLAIAAGQLSGIPHPSSSSLPLKSETALLVLSCHLALLRLCKSLFRGSYQYFIRMSPGKLKSMKVKAVLRIGGLSLLQDMPAKAYAMGVVDMLQTQIQQLESLLGIPAAYSLLAGRKEVEEARDANISRESLSPLGIFKGKYWTQLLQTVMEQEDVSSCIRSIRDNLKTTLAFLG